MYRLRYGSKYGAKRQEFNGKHYMSKKEAGYAAELELRQRAGEIKEIHTQFKLSMDINGYHICNYFVDFMVVMADDTRELHEVKGFETDVWKMKWKLTEALYGEEYKLIVIK